jgi:hypothetical protein
VKNGDAATIARQSQWLVIVNTVAADRWRGAWTAECDVEAITTGQLGERPTAFRQNCLVGSGACLKGLFTAVREDVHFDRGADGDIRGSVLLTAI